MKEKVALYGQNLKSSDILTYLPDAFKRKLSNKEIRYIQDAFYKVVLACQKRDEQDYLNKMLI